MKSILVEVRLYRQGSGFGQMWALVGKQYSVKCGAKS